MPRRSRIDLAHVPQHVVQRGNDRQPCFFTEVDRIRYLDDLRHAARQEHCAVHAYVLMSNHVHLLLTPAAPGQVSWLMQSLGRRYVRYINDRYHRTGTLWEGRYKACLVDSDTYLLRCHRYIELNPVRAGMVRAPGDYRWSSYRANAYGEPDPLISPHPVLLALGASEDERKVTYRALVAAAVEAEETDRIRSSVQCGDVLGDDRFRATIEARLGRRAGPAKVGRPRKSRVSVENAL